MNIRIAHIEGGEISGSIDERIRHAITKMAHIHFVSNEDAKERVIKMGEKESTVHICGTPTIDIIKGLDINNTESLRKTLDQYEDGRSLSLESPYIVVSQHSVVTEYKESSENIRKTIEAIKTVEVPVVWILPNDDAGTAIIEDEVNKIKYVAGKYPIIKIRGMGIEDYSVLLYKSRCLVGNTSSGIRECSYLGVPVVNIGTRQNNRLRSANVIDVGYDVSDIKQAIKIQQEQGRFKSNELYGDGNAARKMVNVLERPWPMIDKQITY